jgi:thioredoxin reductase
VDGVKRRTGAGMGRCQGGFCTERVIKLLAEERGCPSNEVLKDGSGSVLVVGVGSASEANGADAAGAVGVGDASATGAVGVGNASATGNTCVSSGLASKIGSTPFSPQLLIVGGGGAGIAAALAAHETGVAAKDLLLVDRHPYLGGILPQCLHAGFGVRTHAGELNGPEFLRPLVARFEALEIPHFLRSSVLKIALDHTVMLATSEGFARMRPRALVLATGCRERACGSLPIAGMRPAGIFTAGAAQKMVNVNGWNVGERFVVLGSGDVGLIMAGRFAALGKDVVAVLEQGARCGGLHRNRVRYLDKYGIPLLTHSTITQVFGTTRVTGVEVQTREPNGTTRRWELACDTLITSVGLICETDLLGGMKDAEGVRHQGEPLAAPPPWVFVAGNARKVRPFIEDVIDDGTAVGRAAARLT